MIRTGARDAHPSWRLLLLGVFLTSSTLADEPRAAPPMRGPDFVIGAVRSWKEAPGQASELLLEDGSRWMLASQRADYEVQKAFIVRAVARGGPLFVSGDRLHAVVDRVATARPLAAQRVESASDGRFSVLFAGPPSLYYLRPDRPGAAQTLELLRRSAARALLPNQPDLLVGIDTVTSEVILALLLPAAAPPAR